VRPTSVRPRGHSAVGSDQKSIHLSARQLMYLKNTSFLPEPLAALIRGATLVSTERYALELTALTRRQFRAAFTDRLAQRALSLTYDPTIEGVMLEGLLDRFGDF
jgi:hypothetical protein